MPSGKRRKRDFDAKAQAEMERSQAANEPKPISEVLPEIMAALPAPSNEAETIPAEAETQEAAPQTSRGRIENPPPFDDFRRTERVGGEVGRARFGRDNHPFRKQMVMKFDGKPPKEIRDLLTQEGWHYRDGPEKNWTKQLSENAYVTHSEAERLFNHVVSTLRELSGQEQSHSR